MLLRLILPPLHPRLLSQRASLLPPRLLLGRKTCLAIGWQVRLGSQPISFGHSRPPLCVCQFLHQGKDWPAALEFWAPRQWLAVSALQRLPTEMSEYGQPLRSLAFLQGPLPAHFTWETRLRSRPRAT